METFFKNLFNMLKKNMEAMLLWVDYVVSEDLCAVSFHSVGMDSLNVIFLLFTFQGEWILECLQSENMLNF